MSCQKTINIPMLLICLNDISSPSQIRQPDDEMVDEELNVAHPDMDDFVMSEQGSGDCEDPASGNEEILEFPGFSDGEGDATLDAEIDCMPDLGIPAVMESESESRMSLKVTQVGVRRRSRGQHTNQCLQCKERGSLRRRLDEFAGTASTSSSKKHKADNRVDPGQGPTLPATPRPPVVKRGVAFHGGLSKNWKAQSNRSEY